MQLVDSHIHFVSHNFLRLLTQLKHSLDDVDVYISEQAKRNHFEPPPADPARLADRWVIEMDRHGVSRSAVITMTPGDEISVSAALRNYPERFIGVAVSNPYLAVSEELLEHAVTEWGFRGVILYPALHRFSAASDRVYPIYRLARKHRLVVYVHFGRLRMPLRRWWGLPDVYDWNYADPSDLHQPAADFPSVNFVVPSFGAGTLSKLLRLGLQCPNLHIDTSSSNSWIEDQSEFPDLRTVFARTLEVFGPGRVLFGSDSSFFPRGWRVPVYIEQKEILSELGLSDHAKAAIMGGNAQTLYGFDR